MATNEINQTFVRTEVSGETNDAPLLRNAADDSVVLNEVVVQQDLVPDLWTINKVVPDQGLMDFLARPQLVNGGVFQTSNTPGLAIASLNCSELLFNWNLYKEKLNGFGGIRYTTKVTLQINAERFQQGFYYLFYIPCYTHNASREASRFTNIITWSQLPGVEVDLSCDTEVVLRIPYVSPALYSTLDSAPTSIAATFFLYCLSPLNTGTGSASATYNIWMSYEDVELFAPTASRATLQMGPNEDDAPPSASAIMRNASKTFKEIAKVPILNSVAAPLAWVTGVAGKTLASFGWSKPTNTMANTIVQQQTMTNAINADGATNVVPMGMFSTNQVGKLNSFGETGVDEMAISYLCQKRSYYKTASWSTSTGANVSLFEEVVSPSTFAFNSGTVWYPTPMFAIGKGFQYWRGSIKFRIKVVKTEMHSGRLLIMFGPGVTVGSKLTNPGSGFMMRDVVDLRMGSEFEFTVPYVAPSPWKPFDGNTGMIAIKVLNMLRAPTNCAQTVQVVMFVSAGDDFKVAVPRDISPVAYLPQIAAPLLRATTEGDEPQILETEEVEIASPGRIKFQAGPENPCTMLNGTIGGSKVVQTMAPSIYAIGEEIQSIKQLISATTWMTTKQNIESFFITPTAWGTGVSQGSVSDTCDGMSYWAACYVFNRGSVDLHICSVDERLMFAKYYPSPFNSQPYSTGTFPGISQLDNRITIESPTKRRVWELRVPQYGQYHAFLNYLYAKGAPLTDAKEFGSSNNLKCNFLGGATNVYIGRSAGDDFQFGFWLGAFPMCLGI